MQSSRTAGGRVYATAINCLTLETYYRYPQKMETAFGSKDKPADKKPADKKPAETDPKKADDKKPAPQDKSKDAKPADKKK